MNDHRDAVSSSLRVPNGTGAVGRAAPTIGSGRSGGGGGGDDAAAASSSSSTSSRKQPQSGPGSAAAAPAKAPGAGRAGGGNAGDGRSSGNGGCCGGDGGDSDELSVHFSRLSAAVEARMRSLRAQEEQLRAAEAQASAAAARLASAAARRPPSDIIPLNVGGSLLATSRRTLTLVPDSLLGTMFSGSWDEHLQRDEAGRVFLDYDPVLFAALLNWLRAQDLGGLEGPLGEPSVAAGQEEQLLVLVDFLQLQRHVPCRYPERFCPSLSSPFMSLSGGTAWRAAGGGAGSYAVAAAAHCLFDVDAELLLEVLRFGAVARVGRDGQAEDPDDDDEEEGLLPDHPMFIGIMARQQLEALDRSRPRSNASWQSSSHGWWTGRQRGAEVRGGKSRMLQRRALWAEGDSLYLSVDAAKHPHRQRQQRRDAGSNSNDNGNGTQQRAQGQPQEAAADAAAAAAAADAGNGGTAGVSDLGAAGAAAAASAARMGPAGPRLTLTNTRTSMRLELEVSADCLGEGEDAWEEQWVVVVGLAGRADEVRINSARRKGCKPQLDALASDAAAAAAAAMGTAVAGTAAGMAATATDGGHGAGPAAGGAGGGNGPGGRRRGGRGR